MSCGGGECVPRWVCEGEGGSYGSYGSVFGGLDIAC